MSEPIHILSIWFARSNNLYSRLVVVLLLRAEHSFHISAIFPPAPICVHSFVFICVGGEKCVHDYIWYGFFHCASYGIWICSKLSLVLLDGVDHGTIFVCRCFKGRTQAYPAFFQCVGCHRSGLDLCRSLRARLEVREKPRNLPQITHFRTAHSAHCACDCEIHPAAIQTVARANSIRSDCLRCHEPNGRCLRTGSSFDRFNCDNAMIVWIL